jgi:translocation and assembly module TamB
LPVAGLAPATGNWLAPEGTADVQLALEPSGLLKGELTVSNVATRPLGPVGTVRIAQGTITLKDRRARMDGFQMELGGQPVRLTGDAEWDSTNIGSINLGVTGTNLVMVRAADLLIRGNLDLKIQSETGGTPRVSGEVLLSDSLLFHDLADLMRLDLNRPEQRPPYFSVTQPPLDNWQLDVRVRGERFLKVISPFFRGEVSTGMQLTGTLREPQAIGEVIVEQGNLLFPFGTLELNRGVIRLTRQDPHHAQLDLHGDGLNFGYNIRVEISGTADKPQLLFTSVPPLSSRQILSMLTAGQVPGGNYEFSDADKAQRFGLYFGKELVNQLIGTDSTSSRLSVRTGEYVTDEGRLTYTVEYELIDWLSVFGEYSRFRDYNAGLKFRVYSK